MDIINKISQEKIFANNPPIVVDIGASGFINESFKPIAKHSICLAADADKRDIQYLVFEEGGCEKY